jgi:sulfur relay (sulfurtransferase) DsrF/TusC family protein
MTDYLLVESGGPSAGPGCDRFLGDAARLAAEDAGVTLLLVENGVTAAVRGARSGVDALVRHGGELWVDSFSLRQRAVCAHDLVTEARVVEMADVAERLLQPGLTAVWH